MPELPEVETIVRGLGSELERVRISSLKLLYPGAVPKDRAAFKRQVPGRTITRVLRRGKLLLIELSPPLYLAFHLKMTGRLILAGKNEDPDKHTRIVFQLANKKKLFFKDMRKFGYCRAFSRKGLDEWGFYATLGPEPLEIGTDEFVSLFSGRRARIKSLLLNQRVIAGIGNIYADEALFRARIRPDLSAADLDQQKLIQLCRSTREVLSEAIAANGSSIRDYQDPFGRPGSFQDNFKVYGKSGRPCPVCGTALSRSKVAGRTSTWCKHCQR
ncbi:MAG: bifunctional DNA-formamidopyrimidine glycosylase/DNA-(apurinic or apyrimidinic site) lyase [Thermodesulfobacteriota bacterium]|nr:bifunctional DNA-formamidopyrimidine glycosylase/DNA-(apurinic or apyrimidinic site) lyase [Thermodesulfobacteriota bacterium]